MEPTASKDGSLVFLVEELGDARVRAEQLKGYFDKALKLINQSEKKEHIYEMAGGLIQEAPEALFKLLQALRAAAMASSKLDYEILKSQISPSKVEELESVLDDVRVQVREVDSTDPPPTPYSPPVADTDHPQKKLIAGLRKVASEIEASPNPPRKRVIQSIWELIEDKFVMNGGYYYPMVGGDEPPLLSKTASVKGGTSSSSSSSSTVPHKNILLSAVKAMIDDPSPKEGLIRLSAFLAASGKDKAADLIYQAAGHVK